MQLSRTRQAKRVKQAAAPGTARRYAPHPRADGSSTVAQIAAGLYVRPRTGPQSAPVWWPAVAEPQAASVPTALTAAPGDIRMDRAIPKCPPPGRRHNNSEIIQ